MSELKSSKDEIQAIRARHAVADRNFEKQYGGPERDPAFDRPSAVPMSHIDRGALLAYIDSHGLAPETTCSGWQPTDTAPRDTVVLTLRDAPVGPLIALAKFSRVGNMGGWLSVNDDGVGYFKVTHWMPIPAFPVKTSPEQK